MTRYGFKTQTSVLALVALIALSLVSCGGTSETVEVSGTTGRCTNADGISSGEVLPASGVQASLTGYTGTCPNYKMSDERVSGSQESVIDCEFSQEGESTVGECQVSDVIHNEGGGWEGNCEGTTSWSTSAPNHVHVFDCTYLGTGDYDGLRYVAHNEGLDTPWTVTGTIESIP